MATSDTEDQQSMRHTLFYCDGIYTSGMVRADSILLAWGFYRLFEAINTDAAVSMRAAVERAVFGDDDV